MDFNTLIGGAAFGAYVGAAVSFVPAFMVAPFLTKKLSRALETKVDFRDTVSAIMLTSMLVGGSVGLVAPNKVDQVADYIHSKVLAPVYQVVGVPEIHQDNALKGK